MCLNFVGELTQKCDTENREWWWRPIKSIYRLHLDLVVKQLCCINCLNAWATSCATFRNQKLLLIQWAIPEKNQTEGIEDIRF